MGTSSSIMQTQEIPEFRKLTNVERSLEIPAASRNRNVTDKKGFVIFAVVFVIFVPFLVYTLVKSDLRRLKYGTDSCGNFCGILNSKIEGFSCSGKDYRNYPYEWINLIENKKSCKHFCPPGETGKDGKCYDSSKDTNNTMEPEVEAWDYTRTSWWKFIIVIITTIILCMLMLALYRYVPEVMVWGILAFGLLLTVALTCLLWYGYSQMSSSESARPGVLVIAIISTLFTILAFLLVAILFKKIKIIILLFKETAKAIFAMPLLMILPVITMFIQFIILGLLVLTMTWMVTSAELEKIGKDNYNYVRNGAMTFAMIFNIVMAIWALQFFAGCQYMISAGSVASWYFAGSNRLFLNSPIWTSFVNTVKYHLGTIAFGSFILTLVAVIKAALRSLVSNSKCRWIVDCCCNNVEAFLKFLSKNAYIETALHGQSFFRSGKRAAQLLIKNAANVIAINSVGDFVIWMTQFLLLVISTGIAYALFSDNYSYGWVPTVISLFVNIVIIVLIFAVFETTVDTLFICFCEDSVLNDGMSKPYYMSKGLKQFVENSKKVYKEKK